MTRKSGQIRQKPEAEQSRRKNIKKECSVPRGKCAAKGKFWRGVIQRKRGANNLAGRSSADKRK